MGAWSSSSLGNDTACDWADELKKVSNFSLIESTFHKVDEIGADYLEAPTAEEAIAAADTLVRLLGKRDAQSSRMDVIDDWVAKYKLIPSKQLLQSAVVAIDRILQSPSELRDLWEESDEFEIWQKNLEGLRKELSEQATKK